MKRYIFLLLCLLATRTAMGQATPFQAGYPTTLPSSSNLGNGANNAKSTLNGTITSGATTLVVASASTFPAAPFPLTCGSEIMIVTAKSGTTFTATRGAFGTTAASHSTGTAVNLNVVWGYHSVLESEVINTATLLGTNATQTHPVSGSIFIGASASTNRWAVPTGDVAMDNTGAFTITNKLSTNTARTTIVGTTAATMTNPRDVQVDGKIAYVTNFGANQVNLYDVSIPASPTLISTISDADLNAPRQTQVQGKYLYVANQSGNSYTVFDITNPKLPVKLVTKSGGSIAAPGGIYVRGKYLYLTGTATGAQFTIFDNTNPAVPIELGSYTPPSGEKFGRCSFQSKYAYCPLQSSGPFTDDGLYIINISNSASPSLTGRYLINGIGTTGAPVDSSIIGNIVYMLDEGGGMRVIDVTDPTTIVQLGYTTTGIEGGSTGMWAQGRYVYVGAQINNTVVAYDVITPASPVVVSTSAATLNVPSKLTVVGRYLYVVNRGSGTMSVVDLGQDDIAQLKAGAVQGDYLSATNGLRAGYGAIDGDFFVGRTAQIGDNLSVNGDAAISGLLKAGSGPTTLTDATGKILSTALNTVGVGQGGSGAVSLTGILVGNGTSAFTAVTAPSGTIVGTTDAQSLTNKKLGSLTTNGPIYTSGGDGTLNSELRLGLIRGGTNADLSGTGGTSQVLKQTSVGGAVTVARLACADLSDSSAGCSSAGASGANPTATVGTVAVNGSAGTFLRSDGAPAIDQTMTPTWTGVHTFNPTARTSGSAAYFKITIPSDTTLATTVAAPGFQVVSATRQWAAGAITEQKEAIFNGPTYGFVGASTITRAINLYVSSPIVGTNATLTKSIAALFESSAAAHIPLAVRAAGSQSGDLVQILDSSSAVLTNFRSDGTLFLHGSGSTAAAAVAISSTNTGFYLAQSQDIGVTLGGNSFATFNLGGGASEFNLTTLATLGWGASANAGSNTSDAMFSRRGAGNIRIGNADVDTAPVAQIFSVQSALAGGTSNVAGANWTFTGSQGKGTGLGGSIIFQVAPAGSTGTAVNALATALTIDSTRLATFAGAISVAGHATVEGVTSTGATGTNKFVFDTSPTIVTPTIAKLANLTTNGMQYVTGGDGTLNTAANVTTDGNALTVTNNANAVYSLFGQVATNLPIPVNGSNDLVASFIDTSTSGAKVALSGVFEWQGTSNSSGNYNGASFSAGTSTASNANLTAAGPTGGLIANNSSFVHNGSGIVTYGGVFNGRVRNLGTGSITTGYTFQSQNLSIAAATTTTEFDDFVVAGGSVAGTITTRYGMRVKSLVSGTTRWGFYADVDPSFFGGNVTFNAPAILKSYIVSGLPSASTSGAGAMAYVTDSTATAITGLGLAVVGSGANKVMVVSDGTSWIVQ